MTILVLRQNESINSPFGIYVNGELIEGGFFSKRVAEQVARTYKQTWQWNVKSIGAKKGN